MIIINNITYAFLITLIAGFSTFLGYFLLFSLKKKPTGFLVFSLAFASSIMITVSILDLLPSSYSYLSNIYSPFVTLFLIAIFVLVGMLFTYTLDKYLPNKGEDTLYKIGILSMLAIVFHNIPEGMVTFIVNTTDKEIGLRLALAIILHNIPEGICISVPLYYATSNRRKIFLLILIASLSEFFGAFITYFLLYRYVNAFSIGILFAIIIGIMSRISLYELLPSALQYRKKKLIIVSFLIGILIMSVTHFLI